MGTIYEIQKMNCPARSDGWAVRVKATGAFFYGNFRTPTAALKAAIKRQKRHEKTENRTEEKPEDFFQDRKT